MDRLPSAYYSVSLGRRTFLGWQPLWARVGRTVTLGNLDWATKLLGAREDILLWEALVEAGALQGEAPVLRASL